MKARLNNKYFKWGLTAFLVLCAAVCFVYLVYNGSDFANGINSLIRIVTPIVFGFVIAYLLTPILNFIEFKILNPLCDILKIKPSAQRGKIVRGAGVLITTVFFFGIIYALISMFISQIVPSVVNIIDNFDSYISNATKWINKLFSDDYPELGAYITNMLAKYSDEIEKWLNETVLPKTSDLIKTVSLSVIGILKGLWNLIIGFIISIYVLASKEKFAGQTKKLVYAIFDKKFANILINDFKFTHKTFIGFISGKILDSFIIGVLCFVGTSLIRTPYASLVSVIVGVTNIIPFFGPYLGAIPSVILIFLVNPMKPLNCVYFIIFILVLQQIDGNIIGPRILGNSTGLSGFWVIFSITLFGGLFGIAGMIVGVPIFAVVFAAVRAFVNASLIKKKMPIESSKYINVSSVDDDGLHVYTPSYQLKRKENNTSYFGNEFLCGKEQISEVDPVMDEDSTLTDDNTKENNEE